MISLTSSAVEAVKAALSQAVRAADGLRLVAGEGARDTLRVMMHLDVARADDVVIEQGGLKLFLDDRSQRFADGLRIDFVTSRAGSGFVIEADLPHRGLLG
ncbi:iron-sulfur cluster assembly accessory protein [Xanthobacter sp. V4C-4]|uniref:HesB/IscA family protein n=1 Tax=Xanthobacter cornucopiae TaxID=3119924 RepID=UPI00372B127E